MSNHKSEQNIHYAISEARRLQEQLRELYSDDEALIADMIEGETSLIDLLPGVAKQIIECRILMSGVADHLNSVKSRLARIEDRDERLCALMVRALEAAGRKSYEGPEGVFSRRRTPPKVEIIDETLIPPAFFTVPKPPEPRPDKVAIKRALGDGAIIAGCRLDNGSETLQVK